MCVVRTLRFYATSICQNKSAPYIKKKMGTKIGETQLYKVVCTSPETALVFIYVRSF